MDSCFNSFCISTLAFARRSSGARVVHTPYRDYDSRFCVMLCIVLLGLLFSIRLNAATPFGGEAKAQEYTNLSGTPHPVADSAQNTDSATANKPFGFMLAAGFAHDDNVSRASATSEKLSDTSYGLTLSKAHSLQFTKYFRLTLNGFLDIEKFRTYPGLGHFSGGIQGEFMYRASGEFSSPTYGIFVRLSGDNYESMLRDGSRRSVGFTLRNPLTDRINLYTAITNQARVGKSAVFSTRDKTLRMNLDYVVDAGQTFYFTGEYRNGDIISSGLPSLAKLDMSDKFVLDDVFISPAFYTYRIQGKTNLFSLGYNHALSGKDALDFAWRRAQSTPDKTPAYATSPRYVDNLYSISYLMAF